MMEPPQKLVHVIAELNNFETKFLAQYESAVQALEKIQAIRAKMGLELLDTVIDTVKEFEIVYWSINRQAIDHFAFNKYLSIISHWVAQLDNMDILYDYAYTNSTFVSTFLWSTLYKHVNTCSNDVIIEWVLRPAKWQYFDAYWHDCEPAENNMLEMYFYNAQVVKAVNERPVRRVPVIVV